MDNNNIQTFFEACRNNNVDMVNALLQEAENYAYILDQNDKYYSGIMHASENNSFDVMDVLIKINPKATNYLNSDGYDTFAMACKDGNIEVVRRLSNNIDIKKTLSTKYRHGMTPLMLSVINEHEGVTNFIVEKLREINDRDIINIIDDGNASALTYALQNKNMQIAQLLINNGSNLEREAVNFNELFRDIGVRFTEEDLQNNNTILEKFNEARTIINLQNLEQINNDLQQNNRNVELID